jgi:hypothetical protein
MARPTIYTPELASLICRRLAAGESLRAVCREEGMPERTTVARWVIDGKEGFAQSYMNARNFGLDEMADELLEIADSPEPGVIETDKRDKHGDPFTEVRRADMVEHRRLRVDARKWYLAKLAPKRYGERVAHEVSGPDGAPLQMDNAERARRINAIYATAKARRDSGGDLV